MEQLEEVFEIEKGGPEDTDKIMADLRRRGFHVPVEITQANFPLAAGGRREKVSLKIVDPGAEFSLEAGLAF